MTVTLVVKTHVVDGFARILAKRGVELIHAFDHLRIVDRQRIEQVADVLG